MPTPRGTDRIVATLAADQHGVVSRAQLLDAGLTRAMVGERVRAGRLLRIHRGVYAVGHRQLRREGHWLAAVLAIGTGAVLSHRSAAALHGFRPAGGVKVDVTTTGKASDQPGIGVHRTRSLDDADRTTIERIPVTSVARTLVDLAGSVRSDELSKALREADHRNLLDTRAIDRVLRGTRGRTGPGHRALREALAERKALATTLTRSSLEDAFLKLLRDSGLPPPSTNVQIEGMEVDAVWREQRVVVELDGWAHHNTREAFEHDRERDARLAIAGYRALRFTHRHVLDGTHAIETLRRLGIG
jgi:very-short-patch-repair endonuclease